MPAWDNVKEINTHSAYIGSSPCVLLPNIYSRKNATTAKAIIPLENANLSPRFAKLVGIYFSCANTLANRGKPANDVFAARNKIHAVINCNP